MLDCIQRRVQKPIPQECHVLAGRVPAQQWKILEESQRRAIHAIHLHLKPFQNEGDDRRIAIRQNDEQLVGRFEAEVARPVIDESQLRQFPGDELQEVPPTFAEGATTIRHHGRHRVEENEPIRLGQQDQFAGNQIPERIGGDHFRIDRLLGDFAVPMEPHLKADTLRQSEEGHPAQQLPGSLLTRPDQDWDTLHHDVLVFPQQAIHRGSVHTFKKFTQSLWYHPHNQVNFKSANPSNMSTNPPGVIA